jgi:hypothetical protein
MAKKRLNDTEALQPSSGMSMGSDHSVSVRKIDNGFVVRQSVYNNRTGECSSTETFSEREPKVTAPKVGRNPAPDQGSPLRGAMDYLSEK